MVPAEQKNHFDDCYARLNLWADVLRDGSLEVAFKTVPELQRRVLENLVKIGEVLVDTFQNLPGLKKSSTANLAALLDKASYSFADPESEPAESEGDGESDDEASDLEETLNVVRILPESTTSDGRNPGPKLLRVLNLRTGLLMKLLPLIQQVATTTERGFQSNEIAGSEEFQISKAADPWFLQIMDKFPAIDNFLAQRLAEANRQRFEELRRLEERRLLVVMPAKMDEPTKSIFRPATTIQDSGLGTSIITPVNVVVRKSASVASGSSFTSSVADTTSRRVPKTPAAVALGESFDCQICGQTLTSIKTRTQWKRHVFADLKPYLCTFGSCFDHLTVFHSRELWVNHEFSQHRGSTWYDCYICGQAHPNEPLLIYHLESEHPVADHHQWPLLTLLSAARRTEAAAIAELRCPMCRTTGWTTRRKFTKHVGGHMEDISLMALPLGEDDSDDEPDNEASDSDEIPGEPWGTTSASPIKGRENTDDPFIKPEDLGITKTLDSSALVCPTCGKRKQRKSDLSKHMKRHIKPYGCVFDSCQKSFGSKNDWKRHEMAQHEQFECWRCPTCGDVIFESLSTFTRHVEHHAEQLGNAGTDANACRIPRNYQGAFWCGFCNAIIRHTRREHEALVFRFDHISHHFVQENRNSMDWIELGSRGQTKQETARLEEAARTAESQQRQDTPDPRHPGDTPTP